MSGRYFLLHEEGEAWAVNVYEDSAQAAYDFIRAGGLLSHDYILAQECEVSLRLDRKTIEYSKKGGGDESSAEDSATES